MQKHYFLILLFFFFAEKTNAQNWQAIDTQHVYNYLVNDTINIFYNQNIGTMINIWVDSLISTNGNVQQYALNTVFDRQVPAQNTPYQIINQPQFLQKEMWLTGDTVFFQNPNNPIMLITTAQVGQVWFLDAAQNITATVADIQASSTLGLADSVKTIVLSNNDTILLSKNYGILRFPFAYNSPYFYELVGIDDLHLGLNVPKFEEIFDFEVGDMFEYHTIENHSFQYNLNLVEKYEIVGKSYLNDTFTYQVAGYRTVKHQNLSGITYYYDTMPSPIIYGKNGDGYPLLNNYNFENYIYRGNTNHVYWATNTLIDSIFLGYETICRSPERYAAPCAQVLQPIPSNLDSVCEPNGFLFFEHGRTFTVAKDLGFIFIASADDWGGATSYSETNLVAFKKNGITYGTFTPDSLLIAGTENSQNAINFHVFPNPTNSFCSLSFEKVGDYEVSIFNLLGEKIKDISISQNKIQEIDLQGFTEGIYFFEVQNKEGKIAREKFILLAD